MHGCCGAQDSKAAVADAAAAGAQERRLAALERRVDGACEEAASGASATRTQQARLAALEWRTEQVLSDTNMAEGTLHNWMRFLNVYARKHWVVAPCSSIAD